MCSGRPGIQLDRARDQGRLLAGLQRRLLAIQAGETRPRGIQHITVSILDSLHEIGVDLVAAIRKCCIAVHEIQRCDATGAECQRRIRRQRRVVKAECTQVPNRRPDARSLDDSDRHEV